MSKLIIWFLKRSKTKNQFKLLLLTKIKHSNIIFLAFFKLNKSKKKIKKLNLILFNLTKLIAL